MLRATVKDIIAFTFYKRRIENAERYGIPNYGNEETDREQADRVIRFFEEDGQSVGNKETSGVYEDYKMFEGLFREIDETTKP